MLKRYTVQDIIPSTQDRSYVISRFEQTDNPDITWPHQHHFYSIVWFTEGSGTNTIDFEAFDIKPNRLFLMRPNQVHNWSYSANPKGYILVINPYFFRKDLHISQQTCFDLNQTSFDFLDSIFQNMLQEFTLNDELSEPCILAGMNTILLHLTRLTSISKATKKPTILHSFSILIEKNISEDLSVLTYANKLNISVDKLIFLCKQHYDHPPKAVILEHKITEAKRLLYFSKKSIQEIAYSLGFEDGSYFARIFKKKTQMTPTNFKKKYLTNPQKS